MNRRDVLKAGGAGLLLGGAGFPAIVRALDRKPTLRVMGTHVTLQEPIRRRAEAELGFNIEFHPGGSAEVLQRAATDPGSFDLYEQWSNSIRVLWQANAIQSIDVERLTYWDEINDLPKTGRITPDSPIGRGDAPHKLLFVQEDGRLGATPSGRLSFLPYVHNADSFGYDTRAIAPGIPYETESWGWLLDPAHRGRVAVVNAPSIGLFDLALAAEANGLMRFGEIGRMTREEIDDLFALLVDFKRRGHFRGVWFSVPHSVDLMARGEVVIQSMFSPAAAQLQGMGIPCLYAAPREGYRAWFGVMCLSSAVDSERQAMAYAFMNWWLSGWPGAFIARQGYYIANPQRSRPFMTPAEWDYWYAGKPAAHALTGVDGHRVAAAGEVRRGGSYETRFANIAVWNTVMDTYEYTLTKWQEFLLA
ncbi:extracellular solute-binding protein [Guyparkeria hydrothermalis]|uniref:Extracellular solute-binding protein n=1 Tax=Guyparkeria halophila TaxID=47960 RepID=A0A6I6D2E4_9GAMM|nr:MULTISPECIES: extracellular solute-binding protein [Guyparkeria]MCL7751610.1 extracellular solute-binding protein [Guyparkeria hydrothermalis]QGT78073.1 extracellular solute-binding protein [Guyparkeria halophila]TKA90454.1 extracellular solute-binding protein [Guyparkeria sp. SB14A]